MARAFAAIAAVATAAFHLLAALHGASAVRPMGRQWQQAAASSGTATSALTLAPAPAGAQNHQRRAAAAAAAAARVGKWLPFAGVHHHLPAAAAYWAHRPVPWVGSGELSLGGAAGGAAEGGGEGEELVREQEEPRRRPPYEGGDGMTSTSSRQEQLAMWASLLNPKGKGRTSSSTTGWLPAAGAGEAADDEPVKADDDAVEGAEADRTAASDVGARGGQTYWGNNGN